MQPVLIVTCAALALAACASTSDVLSDSPSEVYQSTESANTVAFCLANKNNLPALERDDGSKVILVKNAYGAVGVAFTVYPDGTGSRIEVRRKFGPMIGTWKQCVGLKPMK